MRQICRIIWFDGFVRTTADAENDKGEVHGSLSQDRKHQSNAMLQFRQRKRNDAYNLESSLHVFPDRRRTSPPCKIGVYGKR